LVFYCSRGFVKLIKKGENKMKIGNKVKVNNGMIGAGSIGKIIEFQSNGDIAIIKFTKKIGVDLNEASYFLEDLEIIKKGKK
jgi:hypothetical protein